MSGKNINNNDFAKRILIAPLDWGLGHTTRIIPIIRYLLTLGCVPIIASDERAESLLKKEFPTITFIFLQGYNIQYGKSGKWLALKLLAQMPKVLKQLHIENESLKKIVIEHKIDGIISDNRPSFFHETVPSVYITHQLQIFSKIAFVSKMARAVHFRFINKFKECWVPDFEGVGSIARFLSHPGKLPITPVKYIGPLSRFSASENETGENIVALLSGPEPQRSILEAMLIAILKEIDQPAILIIGKPEKEKSKKIDGNLTVQNHLEAKELEKYLQSAKLIIARAGYSTIMDLLYLQKSAILIPTPGQSEQEYLAEHIGNDGIFIFVKQTEKAITEAISNFENRKPPIKQLITSKFEKTVSDFVESL